jgi:hypothetical protein
MELECRVVRVLDAQKFNGKNGEVVKYGFVCEYGDKYVKQVVFEVFGTEKWSQMESLLRVGAMVNVKFDISSREWNGRWFTSLSCYRVDGSQGSMQVNLSTPVSNVAYNQPSVANANTGFVVQNNDNLPF